jgi:hypothetical protein
MANLTTLAKVKAWLGIDPGLTTQDVILNDLIAACSAAIESYLNRTLLATDHVEWYDGTGSNVLVLKNWPVNSVASVSYEGVEYSINSPTDFRTRGIRWGKDMIVGSGVVFPKGKMVMRVQYNAGYSEVPDDIEQICTELVALSFKNGRGDRLGISSKSLADESVSYVAVALTEGMKTVLGNYRNYV